MKAHSHLFRETAARFPKKSSAWTFQLSRAPSMCTISQGMNREKQATLETAFRVIISLFTRHSPSILNSPSVCHLLLASVLNSITTDSMILMCTKMFSPWPSLITMARTSSSVLSSEVSSLQIIKKLLARRLSHVLTNSILARLASSPICVRSVTPLARKSCKIGSTKVKTA